MPEVVVFRRWKDTGEIVALFPELPADVLARYCVSYEHVGQHGAADYHSVIRQTTPATSQEYARLARELDLLGYNLKPIRRATHRHHERRRRIVGLDAQHPQGQRVEG